MTFSDLISPLKRHNILFFSIFFVLLAVLSVGIKASYDHESRTMYFTVISSGEAPAGNHYFSAEGAERTAEAISGWAKDPNFREKVLKNAKEIGKDQSIVISGFKRKISARKQNRMNVFFTLSLPKSEAKWSSDLEKGLQKTIELKLEEINAKSTFKYSVTNISSFAEKKALPWALAVLISAIFSLGIAVFTLYALKTMQGRVNFVQEVRHLFPHTPLFITNHTQIHQKDALTAFLGQLSSPILIDIDQIDQDHIKLHSVAELSSEQTPVSVVFLGKTSRKSLENSAHIGKMGGIVVFT